MKDNAVENVASLEESSRYKGLALSGILKKANRKNPFVINQLELDKRHSLKKLFSQLNLKNFLI